MKTTLLLFFLLSATVLVNAQPANDDCENAQALTVTTSFQAVDFSISEALIENESACEGSPAANYADVWYTFTMPVSGKLYINGSISINRFAIYDSCGGTEISCFQTYQVLDNLVEGETYFLRVYRSENHIANASQAFYIQAFETPQNDTCATSSELLVTGTPQVVNFSIGGAETNNEVACSGSPPDDYSDIWYDIFIPNNRILHIESLNTSNIFAIYDSCGGTEITCFNGAQSTPYLVPGQSYKLRLIRPEYNAYSSFGLNFTIYTSEHLTNDTCSEAIPYAVSTTAEDVFFDLTQATPINEPGCSDSDSYIDVWYQLTMPANGELFIESDSTDNQFALYDTCNGTQLACFSGSGSLTGLLQSQTLELRVFREASLSMSNQQSFNIYMFEIFTNDTCEDAEVIIVDQTFREYSIDLLQSTIQNEVGCVGEPAEEFADEWFEFTMPVTGNLYIEGNFDYNRFAVYDGCNGNQVHCFSGNDLITNLAQGQTYKLRVFRPEFAFDAPNQEFRIKAFESIVNDDCNGAVSVNVALGNDNPELVTFTLAGTSVQTSETCDGQIEDSLVDAWFQFTMPVDGNLFIDSQNGIAIYDSCNGAQVYCNNVYNTSESFKLIDNLIEGQTYLIRAFVPEYYLFIYDFQSFSIKAFEQQENDNCINAETIIPSEVSQTIGYENRGSSILTQEGCEGDVVDRYLNLWYMFTMPFDGIVNIDAINYAQSFAIYNDCEGTQLACNYTGDVSFENLQANETYYLRMFEVYENVHQPNMSLRKC